jgi:hypothetical protein
MTIPFQRKGPPSPLFPDGQVTITEVVRPAEIEALAGRFIAHNGAYLIAKISDARVMLSAARIDPVFPEDVLELAEEECANGPELMDAVDRLVRTSIAELRKFVDIG